MTEYEILRLGHLGDGIAAGPVYAPMALPGERVTGVFDSGHLRDVKIVASSEHRVKAPCQHYRTCGGCQLQHASDAFVANWKTEILREALAARDLHTEFRPIAVSPTRSRRRATFSARRTKKGAMAGFHAKASDVIVELSDCHVLNPALMDGLDLARELALVGASRKGALGVACTASEVGLDVHVTGGKPLDGPLQIVLAQLAERHDLARLAWEDETIVTRREPLQMFGGVAVVPPPGSFLQATQEAQAKLQADVAEIVSDSSPVIDLFAGCGTFSLSLARRSEIHAVESSQFMLRALDEGWRKAERLKKVTTEVRDLFRQPIVAEDLNMFRAAVIDPPRAGAEAQTLELAKARLPVIAFVSCNPVTFARDARILVDAGYTLEWVRPVDQFRWSVHIELVASFRLNST